MIRLTLVIAALIVAWSAPAHADPPNGSMPLPTTGWARTSTLEYVPGAHPWIARPVVRSAARRAAG